jgi:hypothetical protein
MERAKESTGALLEKHIPEFPAFGPNNPEHSHYHYYAYMPSLPAEGLPNYGR